MVCDNSLAYNHCVIYSTPVVILVQAEVIFQMLLIKCIQDAIDIFNTSLRNTLGAGAGQISSGGRDIVSVEQEVSFCAKYKMLRLVLVVHEGARQEGSDKSSGGSSTSIYVAGLRLLLEELERVRRFGFVRNHANHDTANGSGHLPPAQLRTLDGDHRCVHDAARSERLAQTYCFE